MVYATGQMMTNGPMEQAKHAQRMQTRELPYFVGLIHLIKMIRPGPRLSSATPRFSIVVRDNSVDSSHVEMPKKPKHNDPVM